MRYYDLPKNKMSSFLGKDKLNCELWTLTEGGGLHWHDYYTIDIIIEGSATKFSALGHSSVQKGYMHLVMPSDIHHIGTEGHCRMYSVRFSSEVLPDGLEILLSAAEKSVYLPENELEAVQGLANTMLVFPENEKLCINMLHSMLIILQSHVAAENVPVPHNFKRVMDYIDVNFRDDPSLSNIAKIGSYSTGYLSHLFKKQTGYTYSRYLTGKKLNYACAIMQNKTLTLTDVAISSGFSSFENFNRAFKVAFGCTPKEYRNKLIK